MRGERTGKTNFPLFPCKEGGLVMVPPGMDRTVRGTSGISPPRSIVPFKIKFEFKIKFVMERSIVPFLLLARSA